MAPARLSSRRPDREVRAGAQHRRRGRAGRTVPGQWYRVRVGARGSQFWVFLDGRKLFDSRATGSDRGRVGLRTSGSAARFRRIKVTDPPVQDPPAPQPAA